MPRTLREFENLILLSILRLRDNAYGVTIQNEIEVRVGRSVSIGAVYTALGRLNRAGFLSMTIGPSTPQRGGRRRRFYHIEPPGAAALAKSVRAFRGMTEGIEGDLELLLVNAPTGRSQ